MKPIWKPPLGKGPLRLASLRKAPLRLALLRLALLRLARLRKAPLRLARLRKAPLRFFLYAPSVLISSTKRDFSCRFWICFSFSEVFMSADFKLSI